MASLEMRKLGAKVKEIFCEPVSVHSYLSAEKTHVLIDESEEKQRIGQNCSGINMNLRATEEKGSEMHLQRSGDVIKSNPYTCSLGTV